MPEDESPLVEDGPACCGGGDFYGHEPYCDSGHAAWEKANASYLTDLRAALGEAVEALQSVNDARGVHTGVIVRCRELLSRELP